MDCVATLWEDLHLELPCGLRESAHGSHILHQLTSLNVAEKEPPGMAESLSRLHTMPMVSKENTDQLLNSPSPGVTGTGSQELK